MFTRKIKRINPLDIVSHLIKIVTIEKNEVIYLNKPDIGNKSTEVKSTGGLWHRHTEQTKTFKVNEKEIECEVYSTSDYEISSDDTIKKRIVKPG